MKRMYLMLFVLALLAIPAMAQTEDGPSINPTTMGAILVLIEGGLVTGVTALLKSAFKATGTGAVVLTGVVAIAATAVYFLFLNPPFEVMKFILYAVAAFGEATGFYHIYRRA
jgi:hypothetical protein